MATVTPRVATAGSGDTTTYTSATFTPTVGDLLVVFATVSGTAAVGAASASANGITFTRVASASRGGSDMMYAFVANQLVPASPVGMTVTVDVTGDAGSGGVVAVASVAGMTNVGAAAVRQFKAAPEQAAGAITIVFDSTPLTTNPQLGGISLGNEAAGPTPPTSWTEAADVTYTTPNRGLEYAYRSSGGTTATIGWGFTGGTTTPWAGILVELDATPPVTGTLAATAPAATAALTGTVVAGTVTGTLAATAPAATAALTGTVVGGIVTGTLAATAPSPTAALSGTVVGGAVADTNPDRLTYTEPGPPEWTEPAATAGYTEPGPPEWTEPAAAIAYREDRTDDR